jgi:hypothetical protein
MKENINITTTEKELVIREGKALELREPEKINFTGLLFAPGDFMENRKSLLKADKSNLVINEKAGEIVFTTDDKNYYKDVFTGSLKKSSIIAEFGINDEKKFYTDKEMAKFFRKTEYYFSEVTEHKKIVAELMKFKASVDAEIVNISDNRGNVKQVYERMVKSNIPESFKMKAPIFEGYDPIEFKVLICAEADVTGVQFYLESPQLFKLEEVEKRKLIQVEEDRFKAFGCAILKK